MKKIRFLKKNILIVLILTIGLFLRIYKLDSLMPFIPDQGWFYLSARDMLLTGNIPLVGPPTSHPWIHHGPLWTYTLALLLFLGRFNPVFPAYYIAILGAITTWLMYYVSTRMFSRTVGLVSSLFWATSPLVVMNSRIPYHTSPIPFFVIILFYLTYLWVKGNVKVFPFIMLLLAVLYNHEITTFVFDIIIGFIFAFGLLRRRRWVTRLFNPKIIIASFVLFIIPMIPFLIYDTTHGYKQTFGFGAWVLYRLVKAPIGVINPGVPAAASPALSASLPEFFSYFRQLIFTPSVMLSLLMLFAAFLYGIILLKKDYSFVKTIKKMDTKNQVLKLRIGSRILIVQNKLPPAHTLLLIFLGVAIPGLFLHRVPIEADTLLISPFIILLIAVMLDRLMRLPYFKVPLIVIIILVVFLNTYYLLSTQYFTNGSGGRLTIDKQIHAADKVITIANGQRYTIRGKGELSSFPVFTMPYEYLLWWKGSPSSHKKEKVQIEIWEKGADIFISKK